VGHWVVIRYHFDLYPRDDPRDGTRVVRFTKLQAAEYRGEANGTGAGRLSIRADVAEAQLIDPRGLQYVRVVREDTVAETEAVVGGFWLEQGDFTLLDEQGTRLLSFGGAGTLAYLSRAQMASHTYISPIFTGQDPFDDSWRLYAQSTVYANGNHLGAMLWRVLYEATHNTPGTHKHGDTPAGSTVSDTHDDDRPAIAIPDLVFDFDQYEDSSGNDWTQSSGEFKAQVGENVLAVVKRLMEAGLYVEMDPDTFEVRAWENEEHRRSRTGTTWGASVIYFTRPTGEDIDTGNIKSDAKRAIHAYIKRSWVLAGGNDVYGDATGTTDIPWEGFYYADVNDEAAAAGIAAVQIAARDDAGDTLRLRGRLGTDTANGYYRPFEDALLDDLVTVHTGTDQFDIDDQNFPIAAITVNLRPGGDWDVWYDLGSAYTTTSSRQFQVQPVPAHNHTIPLCEILTPGTETASRLYLTDTGATLRTPSAGWTGGTGDMFAFDMTLTPTSTTSGAVGTWDGVNAAAASYGLIQGTITLSNAGLLALVQSGGTFRIQNRINIRHGIGIDEASHVEYLEGTIRVYRPGTASYVGTLFAVGDATGAVAANTDSAGTAGNRSMAGSYTAVPGAVSTDQLVVEWGIKHLAPTTGGAGGSVRWNDAAGSDLPEDDSTLDDLNSWVELRSISAPSGSGKHPDLTGTSNRAARCDHAHHVVRERAPLATDDSGQGYPAGTWWVYVDDEDDPTEIIATYLSVDGTNDAAVWLLQESGGGGGGGTTLVIEEEDGLPSDVFDTLRVPNGSLTDNGDGSASIAFPLVSHVHSAGEEGASIDGAAVYRTGGSLQNILTETHTALIYETEEFDTNDYWDAGAPSRITIPEDGWYEFHAAFRLSGEASFNTADARFFNGRFRIDGLTEADNLFGDDYHVTIGAASTGSVQAHGFRYLTAGQYVEVITYQNTGETLTVPQGSIGDEHGWSNLFVRRVRDGGGGEVTPEDVMDAGRWEVLLTEDGTEPITTEDGLDWLYVWVTD
jgi:hypothetical protein